MRRIYVKSIEACISKRATHLDCVREEKQENDVQKGRQTLTEVLSEILPRKRERIPRGPSERGHEEVKDEPQSQKNEEEKPAPVVSGLSILNGRQPAQICR